MLVRSNDRCIFTAGYPRNLLLSFAERGSANHKRNAVSQLMSKTDNADPIIGDVVFLFGAGASYGADSGQVSPERPPLMGQLFKRLSDHFPAQWGASSERAR